MSSIVTQNLFLETAVSIGRRLVKQAGWSDGSCTWQIMAYDSSRPGSRQAIPKIAGGDVYQGTAGIALFLGELYRVTGDPEFKQTAAGAMQHALATTKDAPQNSFGFQGGRVGLAYAVACVGERIGQPEYLQIAGEIIAPLSGNEHLDSGIDVIGGAAGAIPALLQLAKLLESDNLAMIATRLGDHLIQIAHKEPTGWSWDSAATSLVRNLLGYAHGAGGIGQSLLELYHATNSDQYLYAAELAFLYERQFFDNQTSNWPDLRHQVELSELLQSGRLEEARTLLRSTPLPSYERKYMSAWCHGAPGIGLSRLRAYELLRHLKYKEEAEAALKTTQSSLATTDNYSLCHGIGGNCETLLYAAEVLDQPGYRDVAEQLGIQGWENFEKKGSPWPCGTMGKVSDPSLMMGEAGIGYYYLRLYSPETPSLLLLRGPAANPRRDGEVRDKLTEGSYRVHQAQYVDQYFGRALKIVRALEMPAGAGLIKDNLRIPLEKTDVEVTYRELKRITENEPDAIQNHLADAFRPERLRYEMALELTDFSEEFCDSLRRYSIEVIQWQEMMLQLAPHAQIVESHWNWDAWLEEKAKAGAAVLKSAETYFLLYRAANWIQFCKITPFAALVLQQLKTPSSLEQITAAIHELLIDSSANTQTVLEKKIIDQLCKAYELGFVLCLPKAVDEEPPAREATQAIDEVFSEP